MLENYFELIGNESKINSEHITENGKKFLWFDVCINKKYIEKTGLEKKVPVFFKIKIYEKQYSKYSDLLTIGKWIKIKGCLNSYIDKNNNYTLNLIAFSISDMQQELEQKQENRDKKEPTISYDTDGVMLWNGKRCESKMASESEIKEMEEMLREFS